MSDTSGRRSRLRRTYAALFDRAPWWLALLLGLATVALGLAITFEPFESLRTLVWLVAGALAIAGVSEMTSAQTSLGRWSGAALIALGVVVAAWPDLTIRGLAILVGIALLAGGILRVASGVRGNADHRLISLLSGAARAIFGVLALSWPDVTVLALSLIVGPAMILFGIGEAVAAVRTRGSSPEDRVRGGSRWPLWLRFTGAALSLLVALVALGVSAKVNEGSAGEPDEFYAAPDDIPDEPGVLLRSEPFARGIPKGARAWRILYTTTRDERTPAVASGIVFVSADAPDGPRPVVAWAHGTTGFAPKCAPSNLAKPFVAGATPALDQVVDKGWVFVATDYVGLGTEGPHPYLIGEPEARSVLDSIRAARQLTDIEREERTVVWGHSQGGGAALWTGILAPDYAPDANVIGVAALSPATVLPELFDNVKDAPVGKLMGSYVLSAYEATYPDVEIDDYVRPEARVFFDETAEKCLAGPEALVAVGEAVATPPYFSQSPAEGPLGARLEENVPTGAIEAPLLVGQGLSDVLVLPDLQKQWAEERCSEGQALEYRTYEGFDHVGVVVDPASPLPDDLVAWTQDRFDGAAPPSGCTTVER
jgi:uncharacterized membrane protein HdeD (DUF308 family)/pimeloyl-ACP methyl ester carboxylesterase